MFQGNEWENLTAWKFDKKFHSTKIAAKRTKIEFFVDDHENSKVVNIFLNKN